MIIYIFKRARTSDADLPHDTIADEWVCRVYSDTSKKELLTWGKGAGFQEGWLAGNHFVAVRGRLEKCGKPTPKKIWKPFLRICNAKKFMREWENA